MNIQKMMQQAQVMQHRMQELQQHLSNVEVNGESGGGMVKVRMTCKGDIRKIDIDPSLVNPDDIETLEDLLIAAVNSARSAADQKIADETQSLMGEMGLSGNS